MLEPQRTNEESQQQIQGVKRDLTNQIHSTQYLLIGKRRSLRSLSYLFICQQLSLGTDSLHKKDPMQQVT